MAVILALTHFRKAIKETAADYGLLSYEHGGDDDDDDDEMTFGLLHASAEMVIL